MTVCVGPMSDVFFWSLWAVFMVATLVQIVVASLDLRNLFRKRRAEHDGARGR